MKARIVRGFPFSTDGVNKIFLPAGKEVLFKDEKQAEALEAEGFIESLDKQQQPKKPVLSLNRK